MSKPVFDIASPNTTIDDWQNCRLFMEINRYHFYYVVLNVNKSVMALKYYQFPVKNNDEMIASLEEIVKDDNVLQEKMKEFTVIYNWPENCLVPQKYFNVELNNSFLDLVHGDANNGIVMSEKIGGLEMYNIYRVPHEVHNFFQSHFPTSKFRHHNSLWMEYQQQEKLDFQDRVSVLFYLNEIVVAVIANGKLQVAQTYRYQTTEDIAYYLLNIYHRFNLKQTETPLLVSGMIELNSTIHEELLKYFLRVQTDSPPSGIAEKGQFQIFPEHYFSPLLKLVLCVS